MPVGVTSFIIVSNSVNDFKSVFRVRWHFWNYLRCVTYHGISSDNDGNSTSLPCGHIIRLHYDAMVWNRFLHYWPCLQGLVVPFPKRQWCGDFFFFFFFLGGGGKLLNKRSSYQWFETPWPPLWHDRNAWQNQTSPHWYSGNRTIALVPVNQPLRIWVKSAGIPPQQNIINHEQCEWFLYLYSVSGKRAVPLDLAKFKSSKLCI